MVLRRCLDVMHPLKSMRVTVGRWFARALRLLARFPAGSRAIQAGRDAPIVGSLLRALLGIYQTYPNLQVAEAYLRRYVPAGHDHPFHIDMHARFAEYTRESDYPVLYFLAPIASELKSVFDLGGSIGNLFYAYDMELHFPRDLRWIISDLPHKKQPALEFAQSKGEHRIVFTDNFLDASGVDLFVVSGALHYFEQKLSEMLQRLDRLPKIVVVNRSPFAKRGDIVTVQDGGGFVITSKLHDMGSFVAGMTDLGYELVAQWRVHERIEQIPLYPELNDTYWGFYFRLRGGGDR